MDIKIGSLVKSIAGHDKDERYFVINIVSNRVVLINGKNHTKTKPKTKNLKHIILLKNYNLDFKNLKDCDIIYMIRCFDDVCKN